MPDHAFVLPPRSRSENECGTGNRKAITVRGADIDHGGLFEAGHTSLFYHILLIKAALAVPKKVKEKNKNSKNKFFFTFKKFPWPKYCC